MTKELPTVAFVSPYDIPNLRPTCSLILPTKCETFANVAVCFVSSLILDLHEMTNLLILPQG